MMGYRLTLTKRAEKQLDAIPAKQRRMIVAWMAENLHDCANPKIVAGAKPIQGTRNGWRYRVGSYRVLARIEDDELLIEVVRVGHRQGVYNNLPDL